MKPNLFIVGAPKCGTTAWFEYLRTHPEIFIPEHKEFHFFTTDLPKKRVMTHEAEYEALFERGRGKAIVGDGSVFHLYSAEAARNIYAYNPDARIIVFLRDQADMLFSMHHQFLWMFSESIEDFEEAWRLSECRDPKSIPKHCPDPKLLNYAALGRFHEQIQRYLDTFGSDRVRIFHFRDWSKNPRATYLQILDFLGLDDDGRTEFPPVNEAKAHRFKWLGKLIVRRPQWTETMIRPIRKMLGKEKLRIADRLSLMLAHKGYRSRISPELRQEVMQYYAAENALTDRLLTGN